jgi:hypothetical protein
VQAAITNALPGTKVAVELNSGRVTVHGGGDLHTIRKAVEEAGFQFVDEVADPGDARAD